MRVFVVSFLLMLVTTMSQGSPDDSTESNELLKDPETIEAVNQILKEYEKNILFKYSYSIAEDSKVDEYPKDIQYKSKDKYQLIRRRQHCLNCKKGFLDIRYLSGHERVCREKKNKRLERSQSLNESKPKEPRRFKRSHSYPGVEKPAGEGKLTVAGVVVTLLKSGKKII